MKTYKFITENTFGENKRVPFLAISENAIETLKDSDTYDNNYGQIVSAYNAGDAIKLKSENAVEVADKIAHELELEETFEIGSFISAFDNIELYNNIIEELTEDEDYFGYFSTSKGFNFWDGSNWKTVTVSSEVGEPTHELLDDNDLENKLNQAIENSTFVNEGFGRRIYETEKYWIVDNNFQGHFESYEIYEKEYFGIDEL